MGIYYSYGNSLGPLNEVYIGKKASLLEMEKVIHELRAPYLAKRRKLTASLDVNRNPNIIKLENMIKEEFGFHELELSVDSSKYVNAYTLPVDVYLDKITKMADLIETSKNGYRFKPEAKASTFICITSLLLFDERFTDAEILAILLHEVGHNFQSAMNGKLRGVQLARACIRTINICTGSFLNIFYISNSFLEFTIKGEKWSERNKIIGPVFDVFETFKTIYEKLKMEYKSILNILTLGLNKAFRILDLLLDKIKDPTSLATDIIFCVPEKATEDLADSFPYIYGYGAEQVSALAKMEAKEDTEMEDMFNNIPVLSTVKDAVEFPLTTIYFLLDPHPNTANRCKKIIANYEYDIQHIDNPKLKKRLTKELEELKVLFNKYFIDCEQLNKNLIVKKAVINHIARKPFKENPFSSPQEMEIEFQKLKNENKHNINFI